MDPIAFICLLGACAIWAMMHGRRRALRMEQQRRAAEEQQLTSRAQPALWERSRSIITQHAKELTLRRRQLTTPSRYGVLDDGAWQSEMDYFISQVVEPMLGPLPAHDRQMVRDEIGWATARFEDIPVMPPSLATTATDYERGVAELLRTLGWDAQTTPGSGDQGVDVIATKLGRKLVVQCKLYSSPVGNGAVQEIVAGRLFERADFAAVVSNADFTKSARQLAASCSVLLLHHDQLQELDTMLFAE